MDGADDFPLKCWPARYRLLDGLRGLASFLVLLFHLEVVQVGHEWVMFFFVISGYCIAAAADSAQTHQLSFGAFLWRRLRRIYPPYFLSILFFLATRFVKGMTMGSTGLARYSPLHVFQNFTLTQWLFLTSHHREYAADNGRLFVASYWSLCYEEQFYLFMGLCLLLVGRRAGSWILPVAIGLMVSALWVRLFDSLRTGFFLDYWMHFSLGCLVYYRLVHATSRRMRAAIDVLLVVITAVNLAGLFGNGLYNNVVSGELSICGAFAAFLIVARCWDDAISQRAMFRPLVWLGTISYSLYLIHQCNLRASDSIAQVLTGGNVWLKLPATIMVHLAFATAFWFCCERPFLNRPLSKRESVPATEPQQTSLVTAV